jgi:hypothetical protein
MKVQTFVRTNAEAVDKQVNDWLGSNNVEVRMMSTAFKAFKEKGWDALAGRTTARRGLGVAISVWHDEPTIGQQRPDIWIFGSARQKKNPRSTRRRAGEPSLNLPAGQGTGSQSRQKPSTNVSSKRMCCLMIQTSDSPCVMKRAESKTLLIQQLPKGFGSGHARLPYPLCCQNQITTPNAPKSHAPAATNAAMIDVRSGCRQTRTPQNRESLEQ